MLDGINVVSLSPGRLRLKVRELKDSHTFAISLHERITILPGIHKVEINRTTGSLLVIYDKHLFTKDKSVQALQQALAEQLSGDERTRLRSVLRSDEAMGKLRQVLVELLSPPEQDRLHSMLQSLAS